MENTSSPSKAPIIVLSIITVIAIAGASALSFLYVNEKNKPQAAQVNTAQETVKQTVEHQSITLVNPKQTSTTYLPKQGEDTVKYSTGTGKFSLEIPSSLGVVQQVNGNAEGSVITELQIGTRTGGLVVVSPGAPFTIRSIQVDENVAGEAGLGSPTDTDTYKNLLESYSIVSGDDAFQGSSESKKKIDTLDAIGIKMQGGMFAVEHIVAKKGDQLYVISYDTEDKTQQEILKLINSSFKVE